MASYVVNFDLDVWQKVTIPMADFGIGANNVGRLRLTYAKTVGQQFWFDDMEFTSSGGSGPYQFQVAAPDALTRLHVSMLVLVVTAPSADWNPTSFANITGGLTNGLLLRHRRVSDSQVLWLLNSKDNIDLFGRFHPQDDVTFADGNLLIGFMIQPGRASVIVTDDEVLEFVVRDNLSTLSGLRGYIHYVTEIVVP